MLKKIALGLALVILLGGIAGYWWWRQHVALPEWYAQTDAEELIEGDEAELAPPDAGLVWIPVEDAREEAAPPAADGKPTPKKTGRAKRYEMRGFHRQRQSKDAPKTVKASRAILEDGELEAGVVLDLSALPKDKLSERDRELYRKAIEAFPSLTKRDVYVGIEDTPVEQDGVLQLGPSPKVRIGNARYDLDTAARKIGMSPAQLREEINRELRRMGVQSPR